MENPRTRLCMTWALEEALRQHFMVRKLDISYAISKPFPFFEGLRDKSFITEKMYMESMEACRNMVPVSKVVYNTLTKLEERFHPQLLEMLFSHINLREYPNLASILKSFKSVVIAHGWGRATRMPSEATDNPAERRSHQTLLPLPAPQSPPLRHPTSRPEVSEPRAAPQHSAPVSGKPSSPARPATALRRVIQKERITPVPSDNLTPRRKDKEGPRAPSAPVSVVREDSPEPSEPAEPPEAPSTLSIKKGKKRKRNARSSSKRRQQKKRPPGEVSDDTSEMNEAPSTPPGITQDSLDNGNKLSLGKSPRGKQKRRKKHSNSNSKTRERKRPPTGTTSPGHRVKEKLQVVDQATQRKDSSTRNSTVMTRAQRSRIECAQTSEPEEKERKKDVCSSSRRSCQKSIPQKEKEKLEDEIVDLQSSELPVTCGTVKGILYKNKMKKGSSEKCIQSEEGVWFTPTEFEVKGRRIKSKNWKRNVRCGGQTLEKLVQQGFLVLPSRISLKRERENADECEVCCRGGRLLCCDTCPRAFHKDCHVPPADADRGPWNCTFCKMKESSGSQQHHRKSKVLERPMGPWEQLKCEFLLLKAYCHPQSAFFEKIPQNLRDYADPFTEAMWLDLVKERLVEKLYTVAWFVRDMRLMFRNHKTFYKASNFSQVGLDLEAEFEKNLKEMLTPHEASEKTFQAPP